MEFKSKNNWVSPYLNSLSIAIVCVCRQKVFESLVKDGNVCRFYPSSRWPGYRGEQSKTPDGKLADDIFAWKISNVEPLFFLCTIKPAPIKYSTQKRRCYTCIGKREKFVNSGLFLCTHT